MLNQISKLDLEEITSKLKGVEFLVNGIVYLNNYDEESFSNGVMLVADNIKNIILSTKTDYSEVISKSRNPFASPTEKLIRYGRITVINSENTGR